MLSTITSMFKNKDIRNRIFFTLAMLFIFRFGTAITVPGVDTTSLTKSSNSLVVIHGCYSGFDRTCQRRRIR